MTDLPPDKHERGQRAALRNTQIKRAKIMASVSLYSKAKKFECQPSFFFFFFTEAQLVRSFRQLLMMYTRTHTQGAILSHLSWAVVVWSTNHATTVFRKSLTIAPKRFPVVGTGEDRKSEEKKKQHIALYSGHNDRGCGKKYK